jgi:alkylhydroperoxidase/carboxymuconolactone decarboxylase family protein YurZ
MGQTAGYQEILRRLAIVDEGFVDDRAGLRLGLPRSQHMDPKTTALVQVGALVAIGSPGVCVEWSATRALAAGATQDEVTDVLLAIAPAVGLGRIVGAVNDVAAALGYDVEAALVDPADHGSEREGNSGALSEHQ